MTQLALLPSPKIPTTPDRFGIAEWYGRSFVELTPSERFDAANFKPVRNTKLSKAERNRLDVLRTTPVASLSLKDKDRLAALESKLAIELANNKICPFKPTTSIPALCTKDGGVCSLRLYRRNEQGDVIPVTGDRGGIRATCPHRFHEDTNVFQWISAELLGSSNPTLVSEVGFLSSTETTDSDEGEDVGRIDMVLIDKTKPPGHPLAWAAVEIQAVYFSGKEMPKDFRAISDNICIDSGTGMIFPTEVRRPDYRSCGPKRLMPQLQIKVPTLRRWGKKMAVVIDRSFFGSLGRMTEASDLSNSDIVWFVVDFEFNSVTGRFKLVHAFTFPTTLEEAVKGLTGGEPVSLSMFEERMLAKSV